MMLQLCIIYSATGLLKSGATWANGTAMYYSLCLDHFYRFQEQVRVATFLHWIGLLPAMTVSVRWWEVFFPVVLIGAAVNAFEREKAAGIWPHAPAWRRVLSYLLFAAAWGCGAYLTGLGAYYYIPVEYLRGMIEKEQLIPLFTVAVSIVPIVILGLYFGLRRWLPRVHRFIRSWVIGRRVWLIFGFFMHIGIDIGLNVGTFAEVMMAAYFAWPTGDEVDRFWKYLASRTAKPGEAGRPVRKRKLARIFLVPFDRLMYRVPGKRYVVKHHPDDASIRRAALLRLWDLEDRLRFEADETMAREHVAIVIEGEDDVRRGARVGEALLPIMPGLWWLEWIRTVQWPLVFPVRLVGMITKNPALRRARPVGGQLLGRLVLPILRQRA